MNMQKAAKLLGSCREFLAKHKVLAVFALLSFAFVGFHVADALTASELMNASNPMNLLMVFIGIVLQALAWAVGKLIVLILGMVIIPILGYNNFANSHVIDIGWPLVRDVVNMFFIIILLVLAVQTILGMDRAKIQQNLPKFFIAVVAVNFSRMISLLIIDAGQVVMFTFVNALRDIAAGNFVGLFQLNSFMGVSLDQANAALTTGGLSAFGFLGSAYVTLAMLLAVLAVLVVMAVVFIYRIVVLWVLVIMSPAAFMTMILKDMGIGTGASRYGEWWNKMVSAVTLGPILTFFLWLGLAAAANGSLASVEQFPEAPTSDASSAGLYTEVFEMERLLSLLIGVILISTGFQVASTAAEGLGGIAAQAFGSQGLFTQESFLKGALGAPATYGARAARGTAREIERRTGVGAAVGRQISAGGVELAKSGGVFGRVAGGALAGAGSRIAGVAAGTVAAQKGMAKERVDQMPPSRQLASLQMADPEQARAAAWSQDKRDEVEDLNKRFLTNNAFRKEMQGELEKSLGKEGAKDEMTRLTTQALAFAKNAGLEGDMTPDEKKQYKKFQLGNMDKILAQTDADIDSKSISQADKDAQKKEARQKLVTDLITDNDEFNPRDLSAATVQIPEVQATLKSMITKTNPDGTYETSWDNAVRGIGVNAEVKEAARGANAKFATSGAPVIAAATSYDQPNKPGEKYLKVDTLTVADMDVNGGAQGEAITRGLIDSTADLSQMAPDVKARFEVEAEGLRAASTNEVEKRKITRALFSASGDVSTLGISKTGAVDTIAPEMTITVREEIAQRPSSLKNMTAEIGHGHSDLTRTITDVADTSYMDRVLGDFQKATSAQMQQDMRETMQNIREAIDAEMDRAQADTGRIPDSLRNKYNAADLRLRQMA